MRQAATCQLGPTRATLVTNHPAVLDYLRNFYPLAAGAADGSWQIEALVGRIEDGMVIDGWGVGHAADPSARRLRLRAPHARPLAIVARTCVREVLVDYCEQRRYAMLHAAAVADDQRVVIVVGDHGSGKTTLALKAVLGHGMRYLSNENLIVLPGAGATADRPPAGLCLTSLPGPIALKIGTFLDLEDRLPPPFDTEGLDIDRYRAMPRDQRYRLDHRVIYTFQGLGQPHPATIDLPDPATGPAVLVALASYAGPDDPVEAAVPDPVAALLAHVRTDWTYTPWLNQRFLPRRERRPREYLDDARRLVSSLAERATVIQWRHHGDPAQLLDHPATRG